VPGDRYGRACGRGATATQPLGPCACGLDRKLLGLRLWPLSMPSVWHSSACMGRASRRSPERLAGPRADLGRTWDREIQDRVHCTGSRGPGAYCPTFLILHPHREQKTGAVDSVDSWQDQCAWYPGLFLHCVAEYGPKLSPPGAPRTSISRQPCEAVRAHASLTRARPPRFRTGGLNILDRRPQVLSLSEALGLALFTRRHPLTKEGPEIHPVKS